MRSTQFRLFLLMTALAVSGCGDELVVAGRIVDRDGMPREAVSVRGGTSSDTTNPDGTFEIRKPCDGAATVGLEIVGEDTGPAEQPERMLVTVGHLPCSAVGIGTFAFWEARVEPTTDGAGLAWQPVGDVPGNEVHYIVGDDDFLVFDAHDATSAEIDRRIFQDFTVDRPGVYRVRALTWRVDPTAPVASVRTWADETELDIPPLVPGSRDARCMGNEDTELYPCAATDGDHFSDIDLDNLTIDLGAPTAVSSVAFVNPRVAYLDNRVEITVLISVDGQTFSDVGSAEILERDNNVSFVLELPSAFDARWVRMLANGEASIGEIAIF